MKRIRKILTRASLGPVHNGWIVEIDGEIKSYQPTQKEWWYLKRADNKRFFSTLKQATRFLQSFDG